MPPGYLKDYYSNIIKLSNGNYLVELNSGPDTTFTGYLSCIRELPGDIRDMSTYAIIHKDKNKEAKMENSY